MGVTFAQPTGEPGRVLWYTRDGRPSTEEEVYRLGGFQTDEQGARDRGLPLPAPKPEGTPAAEDTKEAKEPVEDKMVRRPATKARR